MGEQVGPRHDPLGPQHQPHSVAVGRGEPDGRGLDGAKRAQHPAAAPLAVELDHIPDKRGDPVGCGLLVDLFGRAELRQSSIAQHGHAVGEGQRFLLIVGDEQRGRALVTQKLCHFTPQNCAQLGVERREGLVEQQQVGSRGEGAREGDTLRLPARELVGRAAGVVIESDEVSELGDPVSSYARRAGPAPRHGESDVVAHREVRKQRGFLRHPADSALLGRYGSAGARDFAITDRDGARAHRQQPGNSEQQRRLAATGRPEHGDQLSAADVQRDVIDRQRRPVGHAHTVDDEVAHSSSLAALRTPDKIMAGTAATSTSSAA